MNGYARNGSRQSSGAGSQATGRMQVFLRWKPCTLARSPRTGAPIAARHPAAVDGCPRVEVQATDGGGGPIPVRGLSATCLGPRAAIDAIRRGE